MNSIQNFFKRSFGIGNGSQGNNDSQHHHQYHYHKINKFNIVLDKDEFKSNDKITGKLIIQTNDENIKDIGRICVKFYDELDIQWEEYQSNTLYNTLQYKTYKKPFKINIESYLDIENAILINEIDCVHVKNTDQHNHNKRIYEYSLVFEFDLPKYIHSTVTMPNATYAYYIEAFINNYSNNNNNNNIDTDKHNNSIFEHFKSSNHNTTKIDVNIYNEIMTPNELSLKPLLNNMQITELQTSNLKIKVKLPKRVYFSNETIPITIEIDELAIAFNNASSTITTTVITNENRSLNQHHHHHHHIKLNKIVYKLYQYCKVFAEEPQKRVKIFDYLIKQTTKKIHDKHDSTSNKISLIENFVLPDQLFSSTERNILKEFNDSSPTVPKKISTLSYCNNNGISFPETISLETANSDTVDSNDDSYNYDDDGDKLFYGIRVDYKLVIEFWKNFLSQDSVISIPIMIDPEA